MAAVNVAEHASRQWNHASQDSDGRRNDRDAALLEALDGIELGAHDRRTIVWLAEWESDTVGTIVSLLYRDTLLRPVLMVSRTWSGHASM